MIVSDDVGIKITTTTTTTKTKSATTTTLFTIIGQTSYFVTTLTFSLP